MLFIGYFLWNIHIGNIYSIGMRDMNIVPQNTLLQHKYTLPTNPLRAYKLINNTTNTPLLWENSDRIQYSASLQKLIIVLYILENNIPLDTIITVSKEASDMDISEIRIEEGDKITLKTLLESMIIASANDSTLAISEYLELHNHNLNTINSYIKKNWNMNNTVLQNYTGLPNDAIIMEEMGTTTTVDDMLILTKRALENDFIRSTMSQKRFIGTDITGRNTYNKASTNELLDTDLGIIGVKTGYTEDAGECLITAITAPNGDEYILIMMGSEDRFKESKAIWEWVYKKLSA